jgi:hypothetical protein
VAKRQLVGFTNAGSGGVKGLARTQTLIAALPDEIVAGLAAVFNNGADRIVSRLKEVLPLSDLDKHPGALRESAHKEAGPTDIGAKVTVDAKDERGRYYAKHVEHGHKARDGSHVAAKPAFYPTVRLEKARIRREARAALTDAARRAATAAAAVPE